MKTNDITKIRHLLKKASMRYFKDEEGVDFLICQALALLPCETCGGTGDSKASVIDDLSGGIVDTDIPCPDCQPKLCVCCEEITEENAHLHRNCGK